MSPDETDSTRGRHGGTNAQGYPENRPSFQRFSRNPKVIRLRLAQRHCVEGACESKQHDRPNESKLEPSQRLHATLPPPNPPSNQNVRLRSCSSSARKVIKPMPAPAKLLSAIPANSSVTVGTRSWVWAIFHTPIVTRIPPVNARDGYAPDAQEAASDEHNPECGSESGACGDAD